jgi:hypothetical protein
LLLEVEDSQHTAVASKLGSGILTITIPYLFRTPETIDLWVKGPTNYFKDGAHPLEQIVEADWQPVHVAMHWKLTRPCYPIRFERGEPICMIVPLQRGLATKLEPVRTPLAGNPELQLEYQTWKQTRQYGTTTRQPIPLSMIYQDSMRSTLRDFSSTPSETANEDTKDTPEAPPRSKVQTRRLRIAVYTIAKDEDKPARRWAASADSADIRLVADTGSTDRTVQILRDCGVQVHSIAVQPWRFDTARNAAMALIPADVDVCVSLDMDEVLSDGWRWALEEAWQPGVTRLWHWYHFSSDSEYAINRIHARHGYLWRWPIHELVCPTGPERYGNAGQRLMMTHLPDPTKPRSQYLRLLQRAVLEDRCARTLYYLGREYYYAGQWRQAIYTLEEYLHCPDATWQAERCAAMRHIAVCNQSLGQADQAIHWLSRACLEAPTLREPFVELAQLYCALDRPAQGYAAVLDALRITVKPTHFLVSNHCWGPWPHELAAKCAERLGLRSEAAQHSRNALHYASEDQRLQAKASVLAA